MKQSRNYGIDLLKIVAMLSVVMLHIFGSGGVLERCAANGMFSVSNVLAWIFYAMILPAVNCFVLSTGFVMWNRRCKPKRLLGLWLQVVFYGVMFVITAFLFFPHVEIKGTDFIKSFLPVTFDRLWFFTQYVALFVTMPLLNLLIEKIGYGYFIRVICGGFFLLSVFPVCVGRDLFHVNNGYSYLWFCFLYLCGAFLPSTVTQFVFQQLKQLRCLFS